MFVRLAIIAGLLVSSCVHRAPPCVSRCGMLLEDEGNGSLSCDVLQEAEDKMLNEIDAKFCSMDQRMCKEQACKACFGWQLSLGDEVITVVQNTYSDGDGGYSVIGIPAVGLSNCDMKMMWLGANQSWRKGSYPHEIFHVIQDCHPGWDAGEEDMLHGGGHEGWTDHGLYDFIDDFRAGRR